jgi:hypothetical protein
VLVTAVAALAAASSASAAGSSAVRAAGAGCDRQLSQPFMPWLDHDAYFLVPGGDFEAGTGGWTLAGGAAVAPGNEPWHVTAASDGASLAIPAGGSATAPAVCVELLDPTLRLFVRNTAPLGLGALVVSADVDAAGIHASVPVGVLVAGREFRLTLPLPVLADLTAPLTGGTASLTLHFAALGGAWRIDDVYVDPFKIV